MYLYHVHTYCSTECMHAWLAASFNRTKPSSTSAMLLFCLLLMLHLTSTPRGLDHEAAGLLISHMEHSSCAISHFYYVIPKVLGLLRSTTPDCLI